MKPIYFPFTYVSGPVAEAVAACFGQFIVYRPLNDEVPEPMQALVDKGILDLRVPVTEKEKELKAAVKNYLDWANLHMRDSTKKTADLKSRMGVLPFSDGFSSSKILAEIKEKIQGSSPGKTTDATLTARIFLCLAQEFDRQNQEAAHEIYQYHQRNADLIRQLKMEEDPLADQLQRDPLPDLSTDYMVSDRMKAWTRIFRRDKDESGLFVTHSPAVMEHLLEKSPMVASIMHLESIPLNIGKTASGESWRQKLALNLARWAQNEQGPSEAVLNEGINLPAAETNVSLDVYMVPQQVPVEFFARCAELNDTELPVRAGKFKNTLIGFIERHEEKM
ncbi:MAG: hypothetical protein JSW26_29885 [Desulfobacterales bacterium]|nr:MAG: hypothetical protein JSW26_29885 [Desulfobacterales bacterium]